MDFSSEVCGGGEKNSGALVTEDPDGRKELPFLLRLTILGRGAGNDESVVRPLEIQDWLERHILAVGIRRIDRLRCLCRFFTPDGCV